MGNEYERTGHSIALEELEWINLSRGERLAKNFHIQTIEGQSGEMARDANFSPQAVEFGPERGPGPVNSWRQGGSGIAFRRWLVIVNYAVAATGECLSSGLFKVCTIKDRESVTNKLFM